MAKPDVSVIIPVYNAEKCLRACLASTLRQTLKTIEIICVDDGSTDASLSILRRQAQKDHRIKCIAHKTNQGASAARNSGLEQAGGSYISFLDADDTLPNNALSTLLGAAEKNRTELVKGDYLWFRSEFESSRPDTESYPNKLANRTNMQESAYLQTIPGTNCANLYKSEMLNRHEIRFADLTYGEDQLFQATALVYARSITVIDDIVYNYHNYSRDSVTNSPPVLQNLLDDISYYRKITRLLVDAGLPDAGMAFVSKRWSHPISNYWLKIPKTLSFDECCQVFDAFRDFVSEYNVTPWHKSTPYHHRFLMALLLAKLDNEAFTFLSSKEAAEGFQKTVTLDRPELKGSIVGGNHKNWDPLEFNALERKLKIADSKLKAMRNSLSWKITAPGRWIADKIKKNE